MFLKKSLILHFCISSIFLNLFSIHTLNAFNNMISSIPIIGSIVNTFSKNEKIALEEVMLSIDKDMNANGAVKLHIVIIFEKELFQEIKKLSSREYFRCVDQLIKDHPDEMKIFTWELEAKKRVTPWVKIQYDNNFMPAYGAVIFVSYSTIGEHRAIVPIACKKLKIELKKSTFQIKQTDHHKSSTSAVSTTNFNNKNNFVNV